MNANVTKTVSYSRATLPELSAQDQLDLAQLAALEDSDIDVTDIPEVSGKVQFAPRNAGVSSVPKTRVTTSIDNDIFRWLKSDGDGYQTRINSILREAMAASNR